MKKKGAQCLLHITRGIQPLMESTCITLGISKGAAFSFFESVGDFLTRDPTISFLDMGGLFLAVQISSRNTIDDTSVPAARKISGIRMWDNLRIKHAYKYIQNLVRVFC